MQRNYIYTGKRVVGTIIMSIFATMIFILDYIPSDAVYFYERQGSLYKFLNDLNNCTKSFDMSTLFMFIFIFYFIYHAFFNKKNNIYKYLFSFFFGFIFAFITLIGKSLNYNNTLELLFSNSHQIFKSVVLGFGYLFIYWNIILFFINIDFKLFKKPKKKKGNKLVSFIKNNYIVFTFIFIIVAWIPRIVLYYPATATGDTMDSLAQFFNVRDLCWSAKAIHLVNKNVIINKHHSVFFTMLLGSIVKVGKHIGSYEFGMYMFIIFQVLLSAFIFTYLIYYLVKNRVPNWIVIMSLIFIGISPIISSYVITAIKDTLASAFILLYSVFLVEIIKNHNNFLKSKLFVIMFMFSILMILLLKNNALSIIILSYGSLLLYFIKDKTRLKKVFCIGFLPLIIFLCYDRILLPELGVTGTHKKESFSVPFMQIARVASRGEDNISDKDKKIINKVLNYKSIKLNYRPELSDPVKNTYRLDVTDKQLNDFWKVYFKYMKKYPKTYIASFVNSTYGYFFPEAGETDGIRILDGRIGKKTIFDLVLIPSFDLARQNHSQIIVLLKKIPLFFLLNHVAFYSWFLIFSIIYIICKKNYKYLIPLVSFTFIFGSCLISPVNGSFRYILSIVMSVPLIISIDYYTYKESGSVKKETIY